MNKYLLFLIIGLFCTKSILSAQAPFLTRDSININNINATVMVHGDMWWDPTLGIAACKFPNGSQKIISFASSIWLSAIDNSDQLHVSAQTYRQGGNDYWPGPLDAADTLTYATSHDWAKIWKINKTDIDAFLGLSTHSVSTTPMSILTWPGKGNLFATGNGGAPLSITTDMAPFVDVNGDGIYDPILGDYPDIKGDQALWWVFSDNGPTHNNTNGNKLGIEVHAMSYAWNRGTYIDNSIFYEYDLLNKSTNNYNNFRLALWSDADLGYYYDDFIGFDSTRRMAIEYNGTQDDGAGAGHPANSYGLNPPQVGYSFAYTPGDGLTSFEPAGSFTTYNNDFSAIGIPNIDSNSYNYMHSKLENGKSIAWNRRLGTAPCGGFDSTADLKYLYPDDPSNPTGWSECNCGNLPGDRRFILSTNDFTLNIGEQKKVVIVQSVADSAGGCPVTNFDKIKTVADTAHNAYRRAASHTPVIPPKSIPHAYPNPAHDYLYLENGGKTINVETISIINSIGQKIPCEPILSNNKYSINILFLPCGVYSLLYQIDGKTQNTLFIKQ